MDKQEAIEKLKKDTFEKLRSIIMDKLDHEEAAVTLDKTLTEDLKADSLDSVELIMEVEKKFDMAIPDTDMEKFTTVQSIVDYIVDHTPAPAPAAE